MPRSAATFAIGTEVCQSVKEVRTTSGLFVHDRRRRGVHDDHRHVALFEQRRNRHGIGREIEAREILDAFLDDQLLRKRLGLCRVGRAECRDR